MTHTYQAHGLHMASDIPLPMPPGKGTPNLTLYRGEDREIPHERPPGERLAEVARPNHTIFYTLSRGRGTVLRIGVRRDESGFTAHSWLEIDGRTLDPESARYATLGMA